MTSTFVRRGVAAGAVLAALLAVAGCDGSGGDEPAPTSGTGTASTPPTPDASDASESPAVAPSTGVQIEVEGVSLHAPEGWRKATKRDLMVIAPWQQVALEPKTLGTDVSITSPTALNQDLALEERARLSIDQQRKSGAATMKRAGTVELDGVEFYRNVGRSGSDVWVYEYGALVGDRQATISVSFDRYAHPDREDRDDTVAAILASVEIDDALS